LVLEALGCGRSPCLLKEKELSRSRSWLRDALKEQQQARECCGLWNGERGESVDRGGTDFLP
jgi:hypothetical protein